MEHESPLPARLKEARTKAGLSQKQLGIQAGIDEFAASARMNQYEKGTHTPTFQTVAALAEVLNIPTAYFFAVEDDLAEAVLFFSELEEGDKQKVFEDWKGDRE